MLAAVVVAGLAAFASAVPADIAISVACSEDKLDELNADPDKPCHKSMRMKFNWILPTRPFRHFKCEEGILREVLCPHGLFWNMRNFNPGILKRVLNFLLYLPFTF